MSTFHLEFRVGRLHWFVRVRIR